MENKKVLKRFWKKPSQKLELQGIPLLEAPRSWNFWGFLRWRYPEVETSGFSLLEIPRSWNFWVFAAGGLKARASDACDAQKLALLAGRDLEARASGA